MGEALDNLTPHKRMFVLQYLTCFKPGVAALAIGLAPSTGSTYLVDNDVQVAIAEQMEDRMERVKVDADWVLTRLTEMFEADAADIVYPGTETLRPIHEWPEIWRKMTTAIETKELYDNMGELKGYIKKMKTVDKLKAIELIGKHIDVGAFTEKLQISTDKDLIEQLNKGRKRAQQRNKLKFM